MGFFAAANGSTETLPTGRQALGFMERSDSTSGKKIVLRIYGSGLTDFHESRIKNTQNFNPQKTPQTRRFLYG